MTGGVVVVSGVRRRLSASARNVQNAREGVNDWAGPVVISHMSGVWVEGVAILEPGELVVLPDAATEAFRLMTARQLDKAYRLAWAILGDAQEAEDATQDAFASAWRNRNKLRDVEKLEAWLGRILVNSCRDRLRRRSRDRAAQALDPSRLPPVADHSEEASSRDELARALDCLDPDHRIVVILRFWADLTVEDIAQRIGIAEGTVKSRLHHSMQLLRAALKESR
jgi:RNA polymerase sigma-70 factor (ECF subfamily)